eukprot:COSAG01_NODE_4861_length_4677_cov_5.456313_6_plen_71_part_00
MGCSFGGGYHYHYCTQKITETSHRPLLREQQQQHRSSRLCLLPAAGLTRQLTSRQQQLGRKDWILGFPWD